MMKYYKGLLLLAWGILIGLCSDAQTKSNGILHIDSSNCYIIDNFLNAGWGNQALAAGYGNTKNMTAWIGSSKSVTIPAMNKGSQAMANDTLLNYTVFNVRAGNYNDSIGLLNLKDLFQTGNSSETYSPFAESQVKSYLQLPTLPSVGKLVLFVLKAASSLGIVVDSKQADGSWVEVARFAYPTSDSYISLDTITGNHIISQTPVIYRIRSYSYNSKANLANGPLIGRILVQKYIPNDSRPPYRPYNNITVLTSTIRIADSLVNTFTESQWLNYVPKQAPRSLQENPSSTGLPIVANMIWNYKFPDQIKDGNVTLYYGNSPYKLKNQVMTGDTVIIPFYKTLNGDTTFVDAEIDFYKASFLNTNLPILAAAYQQTGKEKYARYVALALDKWAKIVPEYFMTLGWNSTTLIDRDKLIANRATITAQRASDHNGFPTELLEGTIFAFDNIYESNSLQKIALDSGYNVRDSILKNYFLNITEWLINVPTLEEHASTNLVSHITKMIYVAEICPDTVEKQRIIQFVDTYYDTVKSYNFKRDGMYSEAFGYHIGYADENDLGVHIVNTYFTLFPPSNDTMLKIALNNDTRVAFFDRADAVQDSVAFPNGDLAPFDDTPAGKSTVRNSTHSYLLPAYGHAMLGDGIGNQQIQYNIGAVDMANHIHHDILGMTLFANGCEQLGNIRYSRIPGRVFTNCTLAKNTVTVDENTGQFYSNKQLYGNVGHVFTNGYYTLFEPGLDSVSALEAYSNTTGPGTVSRYQRLNILNTIDTAASYLLDVFVVQGGTKHDYVINGSTQIDQTASSSLNLTKLTGTYPLLAAGATYTDPINELDNRNWYGAIRQAYAGKSNGNWNATFIDSTNTGVRIFAVDDSAVTVNLAQSPYPYRRTTQNSLYAYWRPALIERRVGKTNNSKSVFVHIIEPFKNNSIVIDSIRVLPLDGTATAEQIALAVYFNNGRKDVLMVNMNNELITGTSASNQTTMTRDRLYSLKGKIGVFVNRNNSMKGYLINGSNLSYNGANISIPDSVYQGTLIGTTRVADGAAYNAFVTNTPIPDGIELRGKWISLRFGTYKVIAPADNIFTQNNMNELFKIDSVANIGGKFYIICTEDHELRVNGNTVTQELIRPQRTFAGATTFRILKSKTSIFSDTTSLPLPISIVSFSGKEQDCRASLKWKLSDVADVNQFVIEKSEDGINYIASAFVSPNNSTEYSLQLPINEQTDYYRLKIIDNEGKYVYSKSIELTNHCNVGQKKLVVSPNPSKDYLFNISLASVSDKVRLINILDNKGKLVYQDRLLANSNYIQLRLPEYLSAGIYLLQMDGFDTEKIVIEK